MREHVNMTLDPVSGTVMTPVLDEDARTPEDKAFLKQAGHALVNHLFSAGKTLRMYDVNNRAAQRAIAELEYAVRRITDKEGRAFLRIVNDSILVNEYRIPVETQHLGPFEFLIDELKKRGAGSIEFATAVPASEMGRFVKLFFDTDPGEGAFATLREAMQDAAITAIMINEWVEEDLRLRDVKSESRNVRLESNRVYFRTVALMGDVMRSVEEKHVLQVRKAKRLTQQMVDIIQTDESLLVGLASIKHFDAYTFAHSVNVCILSMLMADRLRLSKADVARIGVAALFHDIGKTYIPATILNSTGQLKPREWELMKYHTVFGVKELSRMRVLREATDAMFVALQHHVHYNNNGYPQRPGGWNLRLFSRIVTIADYYDAMTAVRTYQREPVTPDKALRFILEKSGEIFDPFIAKVFVQAMGIYPVGTIVELDTKEVGVVTSQNPDPRFLHRPRVDILRDHEGLPAEPLTVELTERLPDAPEFRRSVVRAIHDPGFNVDRAALFVAQAPA